MKKVTFTTIEVSWSELLDFITSVKGLDSCKSFLRKFQETHSKLINDPDKQKEPWVTNPKHWIKGAFSWCDTKEGTVFWSTLNEAWEEKFKGADLVKTSDTLGQMLELSKPYLKPKYVGKWMDVRDFSWNRAALPEYENNTWKDEEKDLETYIGFKSITDDVQGDRVLIVEDPVQKSVYMRIIKTTHTSLFVKAYVPKFKRLQWFIFNEHCVEKE